MIEVTVCDPLGLKGTMLLTTNPITGKTMKQMIKEQLNFLGEPSTLFFDKKIIKDCETFTPQNTQPYIILNGNHSKIEKQSQLRGRQITIPERFSEMRENDPIHRFPIPFRHFPLPFYFRNDIGDYESDIFLSSSSASSSDSSDHFDEDGTHIHYPYQVTYGQIPGYSNPPYNEEDYPQPPMYPDNLVYSLDRERQELNENEVQNQNSDHNLHFDVQFTPEEEAKIQAICEIFPQFDRLMIIQVFDACSRNEEETIRCLSTM